MNEATKESVMEKIYELLPDINKFILEKSERVLLSGAVNISDFNKDEYILPKIILSALGKEIQWQYRLLSDKEIVENISRYI